MGGSSWASRKVSFYHWHDLDISGTSYFGNHDYQTPCLIMAEAWTTRTGMPRMGKGLFHICDDTMHARGLFKE